MQVAENPKVLLDELSQKNVCFYTQNTKNLTYTTFEEGQSFHVIFTQIQGVYICAKIYPLGQNNRLTNYKAADKTHSYYAKY